MRGINWIFYRVRLLWGSGKKKKISGDWRRTEKNTGSEFSSLKWRIGGEEGQKPIRARRGEEATFKEKEGRNTTWPRINNVFSKGVD